MNLIQLLKIENFDFAKKSKMIRHTTENGFDINIIYEAGQLVNYQSVQSKDVFDGCNYLISFIATEGTKAKFAGVYEITNKSTVGEVRKTEGLPDLGIDNFYNNEQFYYEQKETPILADLKDRLIIDWGKGTIQWCQNIKEKEVIEILPKGYISDFPGFDEVIISYDELQSIIDYPDANREWNRMLASVAGVYLILDTETGKQYIGSASGEKGILGRWKQYLLNGHGGNKLLKEIMEQNPLQYRRFQYSILRTLPKTLTQNEVVSLETIYKKKLGSRAFGLNIN